MPLWSGPRSSPSSSSPLLDSTHPGSSMCHGGHSDRRGSDAADCPPRSPRGLHDALQGVHNQVHVCAPLHDYPVVLGHTLMGDWNSHVARAVQGVRCGCVAVGQCQRSLRPRSQCGLHVGLQLVCCSESYVPVCVLPIQPPVRTICCSQTRYTYNSLVFVSWRVHHARSADVRAVWRLD